MSETCPALHVLRGAMGRDGHGRWIEPAHRPSTADPRVCGHCHATIKRSKR